MSVYVRYPSLYKSWVAFVLGNSVWTMTLQGNELTRITENCTDLGTVAFACSNRSGME